MEGQCDSARAGQSTCACPNLFVQTWMQAREPANTVRTCHIHGHVKADVPRTHRTCGCVQMWIHANADRDDHQKTVRRSLVFRHGQAMQGIDSPECYHCRNHPTREKRPVHPTWRHESCSSLHPGFTDSRQCCVASGTCGSGTSVTGPASPTAMSSCSCFTESRS